jgi:hypothetical protein
MRRFPPPWTVEALDGGGFKVIDANGQSLAYVYSRENENERRSFPLKSLRPIDRRRSLPLPIRLRITRIY